jgi:curved DNA-binding protein
MTDPYSVLGVPPDATDDIIKSAYRKLAMEHHPDKNGGDDARFKDIGAAYSAIDTAPKRMALRREQGQANFWSNGPADMDFGAHIDSILRGQRSNDVRNRRVRNPDLYHRTEISLTQALIGCDVEIEYMMGAENKMLKIKVPPGIRQGTRMRIPGQGHSANPDIPPGDFYLDLVIKIEGFVQNGADLHGECEVDALSLMVTRRVEIKGPEGNHINFSVPPGTNTGQRIRLNGHGLPNGQGGRGDLIISLSIQVPVLNEEQMVLAKQILALRLQ